MNMMTARTPAEEALGMNLPSRRDEDWKWTDLKRMISGVYAKQEVIAKADDIDRLVAASPFGGVNMHRLVFVNGAFDAKRSHAKGIRVETGIPALIHDEAVVAMNTALAANGVTLRLEGNADTPIELVHVTTDGNARSIATRNRIGVADGAAATIVETHVGEGDYLANHVTEVAVGVGARLDRVKVEHESRKATHLSHVVLTLAKDAVVRDFTLTSGAALNRQNGSIAFLGEHANALVAGAFLLNGKQHADTKLVVDHAVPHCVSRELFKCVMDDNARGIFQGKVIVRKHAQKTDGKQSSHALLLSETAEFDAKPELEIYADDVACGHGATSGDLNHDHMFYLRSRGVPESEAKALLIAAFAAEAFDGIEHQGIREALVRFAEGWVGSGKNV
jgi:Fe-S cluster assembly protein SufD